MILLTCIIIGYILGSIPFGLVLTKLAGTEDIRKIGSGSIGATNVLRTGRKDLALLTVIFDASKAGIAALLACHFVPEEAFEIFGQFTTTNIFAGLTTGTAAIIGHNFPIWLKFKGGKGVASSFGFILATCPAVAGLAGLVWLIMAFTFKYSSLSAITAAILVPVFSYYFAAPIYTIFYTAIVILLILRHHANIVRLLKGQESKIKLKKK